jgi:hypothetical protein
MSIISQYKTSKYITLFSTDAVKITNSAGTNNVRFSWNITNQNLSANAKVGLVNIVANTVDNTLFNLYCEELTNDGFTSFGVFPVLYSGRGLNVSQITNVLYHNINGLNFNNVDIYCGTGVPTGTTDRYNGILTTVTFAITLHILDSPLELVQPQLISFNNGNDLTQGNRSTIKPSL